jgi:hypothetical protein
MGRKAALYGVSFLILFAIAGLCAYVAGNIFVDMGILYGKPTKFDESSYAEFYANYLQARDDEFGWRMKESTENDYFQDAADSRLSPAFPDPEAQNNCVTLYGDSYTYSSEVDSKHAWGNVLAEMLNCRVANYGVGGYGSDQAYLRFLAATDETAPVVMLNHLSENILRNVAQWRSLMYRGRKLTISPSFKPRFIVDESGSLLKIDMPTFEPEQFEQVADRPEDFLPHDFFIPGGDSGLARLEFPYTLSILNVLRHFHVQAEIFGHPWYMPFYAEDHPSQGLQVTSAIMQEFHRTALERGKIPLLTVIPTGLSLLHYQEYGVWPYQTLIDSLEDADLQVLNFGEGMMMCLDGKDPCSLFDNCSAHYNEEGYAMLAEITYEELQRRGIEL